MTGLGGGTVDVPKVGKVKKVYVYGGVAVVLVAAIVWYRKRNAAGAAPATSGNATDSAGNVGTIDPATGFVYGSAEDLAALNPSTGIGAGSSSGGGGGDSGGGGGGVPTQIDNGPPFTSNAAWAQYVTGYMVDTLGMDPGTVANDLGKYLGGEPVTQAERDGVIGPATAYGGQPPIAGPNGYPPSIHVVGSVSGTGSTPGAPTLKAGAVTGTSVAVSWAAVSGAASYAWTATATGYSKTGTGTATSLTLTGLKAATAYRIEVHAVNPSGAGPTAAITLSTAASSSPPADAYWPPVTVVTFNAGHPAWNSTISGIAAHYGYGANWAWVWDDPKNAALKKLRGVPDHIRAGDHVYVKKR